jgi:hypothetical protein
MQQHNTRPITLAGKQEHPTVAVAGCCALTPFSKLHCDLVCFGCAMQYCVQVLDASGSEDARYPHPFQLTIRVELAPHTLVQHLAVRNTGVCRPTGAPDEHIMQLNRCPDNSQ